jgi:hypothetical protein
MKKEAGEKKSLFWESEDGGIQRKGREKLTGGGGGKVSFLNSFRIRS